MLSLPQFQLPVHVYGVFKMMRHIVTILPLLDSNFFLGKPTIPEQECYSDVNDLMGEMSGAGVVGGLLWHVAQRDCSPVDGNRMLTEAIKGFDNIWGCWTILPPQTYEIITPDFFEQMKVNRIFTLRAYPELHRFLLRRVVFGDFLDELAARRIPLVLSVMQKDSSWPMIYDLLAEAPELTVIACDIPVWNSDRFSWPLLAAYPNFYMETSGLSLIEGGLESTVRECGADRILFGSGFPGRYAEAPALQLAHADISDEDKLIIASGNLRRLMSEVKL